MRFLGQILQEKSIHRALESDVEVGDVAFGKRDDVDAGKGQSLEQAGGVLLVAAEPVQGLGEDEVESPIQRVAHERLETRAEKRRTREGVIRVLVCDRPALSLRKGAADSELIGDGGVTLILRRVPRVDPDLHGFTSVENFRSATQLGFEQLASRPPREYAHECAECVVTSRLDRRRRKMTNRSRRTSSSRSSFASSFGHDTPAHIERRFGFAAFVMAMNGLHWVRLRTRCSSHRARKVYSVR
jgi:hypothetical protein